MSAATVGSARADGADKKTVITFDGPAEIPGVHMAGWGVLPAGTDVFKVLGPDRDIVQIFNQDETTAHARIQAIPSDRLAATSKTVITFNERPGRIAGVLLSGSKTGEEFVYPKDKAMQLAQSSNLPVLFGAGETSMQAQRARMRAARRRNPQDLWAARLTPGPFCACFSKVAEPVNLGDAPVVAAMKQALLMAIQPTAEVQPAQLPQLTHPEKLPRDGQRCSADRSARTDRSELCLSHECG